MPQNSRPESFRNDRRATTSVEFAINGSMLFLFILAIINLGYLGMVFGALKHGVQGAARSAAVQSGVNIAANGSCSSSSAVAGFFNNFAAPLLPAAVTTAAPGQPLISTAWTNNATSNTVWGTYLTVTASYTWRPIGLGALSTGIPLSISSTASVGGTSGATTSCS
jgi:Flp pilus assembly protein TadG